MSTLKEKINALDEYKHEPLEALCRSLADEKTDGKLGKVMMPLRAALSGSDKSPALFEAMEVLGKDETCKRIQNAIEYIEKS